MNFLMIFFPFYTFVNVSVNAEIGKYNPWTILEAIAKPNEYVVIKLDSDKLLLENALIKELLVENIIDKLFTKLRQLGIRMHG